MDEKPKRGRPPGPRRPNLNETAKYRNVTLDREAHEALVAIQRDLTEELGFEPTLAQTVRLLIKRASNKETEK